MKRSRSYIRKQRKRVIKRKYNIRLSIWGRKLTEEYYNMNPKGALSKGKIHCSCFMCRRKSYDELSKTDKSKLLDYQYQIDEFLKQ